MIERLIGPKPAPGPHKDHRPAFMKPAAVLRQLVVALVLMATGYLFVFIAPELGVGGTAALGTLGLAVLVVGGIRGYRELMILDQRVQAWVRSHDCPADGASWPNGERDDDR